VASALTPSEQHLDGFVDGSRERERDLHARHLRARLDTRDALTASADLLSESLLTEPRSTASCCYSLPTLKRAAL
jgi:hypothetical protein